jgi:topoisomerase IA-like protein
VDVNCVLAITKNGIQRLAAPPALEVAKYKTENKITDEEILKLLEQSVAKPASTKPKAKKNKKKKPAAKKASAESDDDEEE